MARKLTPQEQEVYRAAIKAVSQALPKDKRGDAPSVTSRLFKLDPEERTHEALEALFQPFGKPARTIKTLQDRGVLVRATSGDLKGAYLVAGYDDQTGTSGADKAPRAAAATGPSASGRAQAPREKKARKAAGTGQAPTAQPTAIAAQPAETGAQHAAAAAQPVVLAQPTAPAQSPGATAPQKGPQGPGAPGPTDEAGQQTSEPERPGCPATPRPARKAATSAARKRRYRGVAPSRAPEAPADPSPVAAPAMAPDRPGRLRRGSLAQALKGTVGSAVTAVARALRPASADEARQQAPEERPGKNGRRASAQAPEPAPADAPAAPGGDGAQSFSAPRQTEQASPARPAQKRPRFESVPCERRQTPELTALRARIIGLDPRLWMNGWLLSHPRAMELYEAELASLDRALADGTDLSGGTLTKRELSYALFGREKYLDLNADGRKLLRALGLDQQVRYRKPANAELLMHVPRRRPAMRVVVSENLDPWLNMRERLYGGATSVLGVHVDGVVFGNGWASSQPDQFHDLVEGLGAERLEVLYWGDIDRSGTRALRNLQVMSEGDPACTVVPFAPAYRLMAERARRRFPDPALNEATQQPPLTDDEARALTGCLGPEDAAYVAQVLAAGRLVPQEIVTLQDLG